MAKKNKYTNMKLEHNELKPITIGIQEDRKKSSIGIFLIMTFFILLIFFMPKLTEVINNYLNPPVAPVTPINPSNPDEEEPSIPEDPDENFYAFNSDLKIERDEVTISNFSMNAENLTLTYTVTNNASDYQDIEKLNYYLEIYNTDRTLSERIKLSNEGIVGGAFKSYTKPINSNTASSIGFIVLVKKQTSDYPDITILSDENAAGTLVCTKAHEKATYKFQSNKLKEMTSVIEYSVSDTDYETLSVTSKTLSDSYNKAGITSNFYYNTAGFNVTTIVNLNDAIRTYIFNADTFKLDTEPKIISFEMEAQGFTCE